MAVVPPALLITSTAGQATPTFAVFGDIQANDVLTLERSTSSSFSSPTDVTHTVTTAEVATGGAINFGVGPLTNGTWYFQVDTNRAGDISGWSNSQNITITGGGSSASLPYFTSNLFFRLYH